MQVLLPSGAEIYKAIKAATRKIVGEKVDKQYFEDTNR